MSVGRTTGRPSPIASTASSTRRSSVDHSLTSREIFPDRDLLVAEAAQQVGHGVQPCRRQPRTPASLRERVGSAPPRRSPRLRRTRSAPRAARARRPRAVAQRRPRAPRTAGWRRRGRTARRVPRTARPRRARRAGRFRATFSAATASASADVSVPTTRAPGCSSAIASAIAPDPSPMSSTRGSAQIRDQLEAALDEHLGLGPRDQDAGIDGQRQPPEPPLSEHVRERLPRRATRDELAEDALAIGRRLVAVRVQLSPRNPERVREQPLRVDARRRHPGAAELLGPGDQEVADGHTSRARRWSSEVSASVNSKRSPSRTWSSRCCVSLIRWSVTRFSAKL